VPAWRSLIDEEPEADLRPRPPVVTILGHVDHGKTTLLDAIRKTDVAEGEVGGITQHIGAYQIQHKDRTITFLDTPGHAAFTAMRARGAQGADIAVLVVAADDGVMPQTREAINHARAARVPIVVALNKIDRQNANPDRVKHELADVGLVPDEWDGDTMVVPVSAKQAKGLEDLLEAILLTADTIKILANPDGKVMGTVVEAEVDRAKGVLATLLVQNGTLRAGDVVIAGTAHGKVRAMFDFQGQALEQAGPSTPAVVLGLSEVPAAGEVFTTVDTDREARLLAEKRAQAGQRAESKAPSLTLEQVFAAYQAGQVQELRLVIKADVQGSLEPIVSSVQDISVGDIKVNVLHAATGNIAESDILLASASEAVVVGFNVEADTSARRLAEKEGVDIRQYDIIYRLTEDIERALKGMLAPEKKQVVIGQADVRAVFKIPRLGNIAGCMVSSGEARRNARVRVLRAGEALYEGAVSSLKHEKDDVREIRAGHECGVGIKGFDELAVGDVLEFFVEEEVAQS
jgi:translation initiation factor IF-2